MPSDRLRLEAHGFSEATSYQFDKAVGRLAQRIEIKSRETEPVEVATRPPASKGKAWAERPKYRMIDLLYDLPASAAGDTYDPDTPVPDAFANLPTALL